MNFEQMQQLWVSGGGEGSRIDGASLVEQARRRTRGGLGLGGAVDGLNLVAGLGLLALLVALMLRWWGQAAPVFSAGCVAVFLIGIITSSLRKLSQRRRLDGGDSVLRLQRGVAQLQRLEYQELRWVLAWSCLIWLPAVFVLARACLGIDLAAELGLAWILANLALGVALLVTLSVASARWVEREDAAPWARRLVEVASGQRLRQLAAELEELAEFEREPR